jgi:hypothetical protein
MPRAPRSPQPPLVVTSLTVVTVTAIFCSVAVHSQSEMCVLTQYLENQNRKVVGPVHEECNGSLHSAPFGNWGVDSNWNSRQDTNQFMGWKPLDSHWEWNSCTDEYPPPHFLYYNSDINTTQTSYQGIGVHAASQGPIANGSCAYVGFDGSVWGSSGNYMSLYELDLHDWDEHVATMYFPDVEFVMSCEYGSQSCNGDSSWVDPTEVVPDVVSAQLRLTVYVDTVY